MGMNDSARRLGLNSVVLATVLAEMVSVIHVSTVPRRRSPPWTAVSFHRLWLVLHRNQGARALQAGRTRG
ncbi:hypothetical protein PF005_g22207 [Phytophthora fragariae]|uniref:Uncharacterized protein n=2 Tax=Phytophthora TaxID=4783 RepID=A0A6A3RD35_9STRA|nr:hypothetical protein PF003_g18929 [Phytophthora fragariae]KAE8987188.1 hypothetical protein PR002_g22120 [Phytophthora rubi]KAE8930146.1 hypothetical protein PF009_g19751 [Phytophthora fragariae]KAE8989957.1 hypothetical protein PR001_g21628 [Phytophthora rubi]KAE8993941.1 hypothetical protein PF011_g16934 [Phytophthora fragariae]